MHGVHRSIMCRQNTPDCAPTYVYRFNFDSKNLLFLKGIFADSDIPGKRQRSLIIVIYYVVLGTVAGTGHGEEIPYLFKPAFVGAFPSPGTREYSMVERFSETFVAFAATSDPNNQRISEVHWDPIEKETFDPVTNDSNYYKVYNFNDQVSLIDLPEVRRMRFWDGIYRYCGKDLY